MVDRVVVVVVVMVVVTTVAGAAAAAAAPASTPAPAPASAPAYIPRRRGGRHERAAAPTDQLPRGGRHGSGPLVRQGRLQVAAAVPLLTVVVAVVVVVVVTAVPRHWGVEMPVGYAVRVFDV